jgi:hypothetical protein
MWLVTNMKITVAGQDNHRGYLGFVEGKPTISILKSLANPSRTVKIICRKERDFLCGCSQNIIGSIVY